MLLDQIKKLSEENKILTNSNSYLKRKNNELGDKLKELKTTVNNLTKQFDISKNNIELLKSCTSELPYQLFESTAKRARGIVRDKEYHPAIRKFALTLELCSAKAYRYVHIFISV